MATKADFIEYVREQLAGVGAVSYRRMFGEYAVYFDGKVVGLICDDQLFLKPTPGVLGLYPDPIMAVPYPGMKPSVLITDELDDIDLMARLIRAAWADLPLPKSKHRKTQH